MLRCVGSVAVVGMNKKTIGLLFNKFPGDLLLPWGSDFPVLSCI